MNAISYLASNMFWFYQEVCFSLARAVGDSVSLLQSPFDSLDDPALRDQQVNLAFICGLPFVRLNQCHTHLIPLAAPVAAASRYQNRPVYYTDVIVRRDDPAARLRDLNGYRFSYNDSGSNSGVHLLRNHLLQSGYETGFFGDLIHSGSHQKSIGLVANGQADCAAIDSLVLEQALRDQPGLAQQIRVITSIGPCPVPLLTVSPTLSPALIDDLREVLLSPDALLQSAMRRAGFRRFAAVSADSYASIGRGYQSAEAANFQLAREAVAV